MKPSKEVIFNAYQAGQITLAGLVLFAEQCGCELKIEFVEKKAQTKSRKERT